MLVECETDHLPAFKAKIKRYKVLNPFLHECNHLKQGNNAWNVPSSQFYARNRMEVFVKSDRSVCLI
jgi:hypothetical protein